MTLTLPPTLTLGMRQNPTDWEVLDYIEQFDQELVSHFCRMCLSLYSLPLVAGVPPDGGYIW